MFIHRHKLTYRMATHQAQTAPSVSKDEALDYINSVRPKCVGPSRHQDFIINMDQTPIPFTYNAKQTLEVVGVWTVHSRKSTNDTKRVTFAMSVTVSGKVLTPFLVFKGTRNGRIAKKELPTFSTEMKYACQENAWMTSRLEEGFWCHGFNVTKNNFQSWFVTWLECPGDTTHHRIYVD